MPLPPIPRIKLARDTQEAIKNIQIGFERLRRGFANAAGEAIDPTESGGYGDGALTIDAPPVINNMTPHIETNDVNKTVEASIVIDFTKPERAVGVEVFYKESTETEFRQAYATESPYRLLHLLPGVTYDIKLAGEAANGALGPHSEVQQVTIDSEAANIAPADAHYVVTEANSDLVNNHILTPETDVTTVILEEGNVIVGVAENGISNLKLRDSAGQSVIGNSSTGTNDPADIIAAADKTILQRQAGLVEFSGLAVNVTLTATGFTTVVTVTASYILNGSVATLFIPAVTGTSNATTFTLTGLPALITPVNTALFVVDAVNNGAATLGLLQLVAASTTINLFVAPGSIAWAATGTKTMQATQITYLT